MIIPLTQYLSTTLSSKWLRLGMYGAMFLSGVAVESYGDASQRAIIGVHDLAGNIVDWLLHDEGRQRGILGQGNRKEISKNGALKKTGA